ncbi:MAG: Ig-like domain repeat protein [Isosphaeraceae bacterium]
MYTFSAFNAGQPPALTNGTAATLVLPPATSGADQFVSVNNNPAAKVTPGATWYTVKNLSNGPNTITVQDGSGNTLASYNVTVDATPPTAAITSSPPAKTVSTTATFAFAGNDDLTPSAGLVYLASLDGAPFSTVTDSAVFSNLGVGTHTLEVEARDQAGNLSRPVSFTWAVAPTVGTTTVLTATALKNASVYGQVVTLTATIGQVTVSPDRPTGQVDFYNGTTRIGSGVLKNGVFQVSVPVVLPAGAYSITATYQGDGTDLTSTSTPYALTVKPAPLTITAQRRQVVRPGRADLVCRVFRVRQRRHRREFGNTRKVSTGATAFSPAGLYPITVSGASSNNYTIRYEPGVLKVEPNAGRVAFVTTMYRLTLGRNPEPAGLTYWLTQLSEGKPQAAVAQGIYDSREARFARARHKAPQLSRSTVYERAFRAQAQALAHA